MSAREELAEVIRGIDGPATLGGLEVADAIIAAGYRKPRVIVSRYEFDSLPNAAVVIDCMETVAHCVRHGLWTMGGDEYTVDELLDDWFTLPATVLYEPEAA